MNHPLPQFVTVLLSLAGIALVALVQTIPAQAPVSARDRAAHPTVMPVQVVPVPLIPARPVSPAMVRIGLLSTQSSGSAPSAQAMAGKVRLLLSQWLNSPTIEPCGGGGTASAIGTNVAGTALNQVSAINGLVHAQPTPSGID